MSSSFANSLCDYFLRVEQILCWELVSKRGAAWTLHYVKSAYGVTDTPDQVCLLQLSTNHYARIEPPPLRFLS